MGLGAVPLYIIIKVSPTHILGFCTIIIITKYLYFYLIGIKRMQHGIQKNSSPYTELVKLDENFIKNLENLI